MELFGKRPLSFFCFLFLLTSALCVYGSAQGHFVLCMGAFLGVVLLLGLTIICRRYRVRFLYALLALLFVALALWNTWWRIDRTEERMRAYEGGRIAEAVVLEKQDVNVHSAQYLAEIRQIDDERVRVRAILVFAFPAQTEPGDVLALRGEMMQSGAYVLGREGRVSEGASLQMVVYDEAEALRIRRDEPHPYLFFAKLREGISARLNDLLGKEVGTLSVGLLLGDTASLDASVVRDFRRAGISHLMAVSGLHMSVILGGLELLLRRLRIGRGVRCVMLSACALFFLTLTGFSMSACRSVLMLLFVYASYLFIKEYDAVTSVFVSALLILLLFPNSVSDVGLWLSFFATLGLICVYPLWQGRLGVIAGRFAVSKNPSWRVMKTLLGAVGLTLIANAFICWIVWLVFREISAVSLVSNVLLSPLCSLMLILLLFALTIGYIPFVGQGLVFLIRWLGRAVLLLAKEFSSIDGAVISLRYPFAGWIILGMSALIAVFLVVRLRRRWLILLPPVAAILCFGACLVGYTMWQGDRVQLEYVGRGENEVLVICDGFRASICDFSSGSYALWQDAAELSREYYATEIEEILLTHLHPKHVSVLGSFCRRRAVRAVAIPEPKNEVERQTAREIAALCAQYGMEFLLCEEREKHVLTGNVWLRMLPRLSEEHAEIAMAFGKGESMMLWLSEGYGVHAKYAALPQISQSCQGILFGAHGSAGEKQATLPIDGQTLRFLFYANEDVYSHRRISYDEGAVCVPSKTKKDSVRFAFVLP